MDLYQCIAPGSGAYNATIIPHGGKFPSVGIAPKPPTVTTPKPVGGVNRPPTAIRPNPAGNNNPKNPVKACKRADSGCDIDEYGAIDMDYSGDLRTAYGHIPWSPAQGEAVAPTLHNLAQRLYWSLVEAEPLMFTPGKNLLEALYVPERGIFLSTVPRDDTAKQLGTFRRRPLVCIGLLEAGEAHFEDHPQQCM
ncbi:hypothetical protein BDV19DRAFT_386669 [Aspergillus venezuelensis]